VVTSTPPTEKSISKTQNPMKRLQDSYLSSVNGSISSLMLDTSILFVMFMGIRKTNIAGGHTVSVPDPKTWDGESIIFSSPKI
jgi:hypothetical protein